MVGDSRDSTLRIRSLTLLDFRNYTRFHIPSLGNLVIFVGPNAVGKTNLLESLALVTSGSTFRHAQIAQLLREGCGQARIQADAESDTRSLELSLAMEKGKKKFAVNGKARTAADMKGTLPSVAFTPDHLDLAKKSSSVKREAIDDLGVQLARNYYVVRSDYEKALRYKNRLLKEEAPQALVDAMDETLVTCAAQLHCFRHALFCKFIPLVAENYRYIAGNGEEFAAAYLASWDYLQGKGMEEATLAGDLPTAGGMESAYGKSATQDGGEFWGGRGLREGIGRDEARGKLFRSLESNREEERSRKRSLVGPHNDKVAFFLGGRDASQFASQGQQRSIVLAWKLAEVQMIRQTLEVSPILLLDDVMSELDERRRALLVSAVSADVQTFITATDTSPFDASLLDKAQVIDLGKIGNMDACAN